MMRTLLWKDFRQSARVMVGAAIVGLGVPYLICFAMAFRSWVQINGRLFTYSDALEGASGAGLALSIILAAIFAGNAFTSERSDRSAEFFASIPVQKLRVALSRLVVAVLSSIFFFISNVIVLSIFGDTPPLYTSESIANLFLTGVFVFGVNWFFSSFLASPVLSSFIGPMIVLIVIVVGGIVYDGPWHDRLETFWQTCVTLAPMIGLIGVIVGTLIYTRRIAP